MAKRVDINHLEIVTRLREIGATVQSLHEVGRGCPDIAVGYCGRNWFMEIKTQRGKLNEEQKKWHFKWKGQVAIVRTWQEAYKVIGIKFT